MAERMLEYSFISSRPSHTVQLPCRERDGGMDGKEEKEKGGGREKGGEGEKGGLRCMDEGKEARGEKERETEAKCEFNVFVYH